MKYATGFVVLVVAALFFLWAAKDSGAWPRPDPSGMKGKAIVVWPRETVSWRTQDEHGNLILCVQQVRRPVRCWVFRPV